VLDFFAYFLGRCQKVGTDNGLILFFLTDYLNPEAPPHKKIKAKKKDFKLKAITC
jgi:hypothetical protein